MAAQTRAPDEVVVVDGGSTDGTLDLLRGAGVEAMTVIEEPRREHRARAQRGDRRGDPRRDRRDRRRLRARAAVARAPAGADRGGRRRRRWASTLPIADGFLQECMASVNLPLDAAEVDPATLHAERALGRVPSRRDRGGRRLPGVARDRRGHVGEPPLARARAGHALRPRGRRPLAAAPDAARDVDAVLPLRARRRTGGDVSRSGTRSGSACTAVVLAAWSRDGAGRRRSRPRARSRYAREPVRRAWRRPSPAERAAAGASSRR